MAVANPIILFSNQFQANDLQWVSSDECDCACPDNGFTFLPVVVSNKSLFSRSNVYSHLLSDKYTLLFNPQGDGNVAILNEAALQIWNEFETPRPLYPLSPVIEHDIVSMANQMAALGLLQPAGMIPVPYPGRPYTLSAWLHVTNECNLRCDYCYISKTAESMTPEVGFAAIDAIIRSAISGGFLNIKLKFSGGEATLNLKLVLALHEYAQEKTAEVGLTLDAVILTNGVAIGDREIAALQEHNIRISISLDGVGETHDAQRHFSNGRGSFTWVNRSIERLLEHGIRPFISITVSDRNVEGLPDVVRYVLARDLPFNLNFYRENDCSIAFADLQIEDDRLVDALHQVFDVIEANLPRHSLLGSLVDRAQFDRPHNKPCGVNESYMVIDHKGLVAQCHMEIERPVTTVFAENPLELLKSDTIHLQNIQVEEKEGCRDCEWRYWCAGGCPLLTYRATRRYDVKSPYCNVYKAIYPRLLRLEGLRLLKLYSEMDDSTRTLQKHHPSSIA